MAHLFQQDHTYSNETVPPNPTQQSTNLEQSIQTEAHGVILIQATTASTAIWGFNERKKTRSLPPAAIR